MSKLNNFKGKQGTNSFKHRPNDAAKYGGRPKSLKKRYNELMDQDGGIIWVDKLGTQVRKVKRKVGEQEIEVEQIGIKLSSRDKIIYKLDKIIQNAKDSTALSGIKFLFQMESNDAKIQNQINIQNNIESNGSGAGEDEEVVYRITFGF